MKAVTISIIALGVVGIIGVGITASRFIINDKNNSPQENSNLSIIGDDATNETDLSNLLGHEPQNNQDDQIKKPVVDANLEAIANNQAVAGCLIKVSKKIPYKDWNNYGAVSAIAEGDNCLDSIVRIMVKSSEGKIMFTMAAPARDFGISDPSDKRGLQIAMSKSLPDSAIRAAAYPEWNNDDDAPYGTEFTKVGYQKARDNNIPVICLKVPTAPQTCVAYDAASSKMKTLQRG